MFPPTYGYATPLAMPIPVRVPSLLYVPPQEMTEPFQQKNPHYIQLINDLFHSINEVQAKSRQNPFAQTQRPSIEFALQKFISCKETLSCDEVLFSLFVFHKASQQLPISPELPDFFTIALIHTQFLVCNNSWDANLLFSERTWIRMFAQSQTLPLSFLFSQRAPSPQVVDALHPKNLCHRSSMQKWHALCYWLSRAIPLTHNETLQYSLSFHKWLQQSPETAIVQCGVWKLLEIASHIDYFCTVFAPCKDLHAHLSEKTGSLFQTDPAVTHWVNMLTLADWQKCSAAHSTGSCIPIYMKNPQIRLAIIQNATSRKFSNPMSNNSLWLRTIPLCYCDALFSLLQEGHIPQKFGPQIGYELMHNTALSPAQQLECLEKILSMHPLEPVETDVLLMLLQRLLTMSDCVNIANAYALLIQKPWKYSDTATHTCDLVSEQRRLTDSSISQHIEAITGTCIKIDSHLLGESRSDLFASRAISVCLYYAVELQKCYRENPSDDCIEKKNQAIFTALRQIPFVHPTSPYKAAVVYSIQKLESVRCTDMPSEIHIQVKHNQILIENMNGHRIADSLCQINDCFYRLSDVQYPMQ